VTGHASRYKHVFTPLRLGPVTIANRIVFSAHLTNYAEDGLPTRQHADYYAARARGGAGLVITEEHSTHPTDWPYEKLIHGFHPAVIPGYRRITEAVHRHNTPIFAQINHNGGQASGMYTRLPVWAPSPVADPLFREVPKEVDEREIAEIIAGYALVAEHCRDGGFDGIELQCSHSSIVRGFLSPATNVRTDRWGGSLDNRARLLLELVAAVRDAIGRDMALGVRLCGDELIEGGTTIDEAVEVAKLVEATGHVDYLNTSIGVATQTLYMIEASMAVRPGYALFIPAALRRATRLPVVGVGRFKDAVQADRAIAAGQCDMVGVVRGQIADPDFARKSRSGHSEDVRLCLSCNQECVGRMGLNRWLGCIEAPHTGRESAVGALRLAAPTLRPRNVIVVGAGPAGLQAGIAAAQHGHRVTVYESAPNAGGQVRIAASVASRAEFGDLVRNQEAELKRVGGTLECGVTVDLAMIRRLRPDAVVIATGATPGKPPWLPAEPPIPTCDVRDVLEGRAHPSGTVLLIDELGFHQSTSVAELLADRGANVEVLTPGMVVAQDLGITLDLEGWNIRAAAKGITQTPDSVIMGFESGTDGISALSVLHHPTGTMTSRRADWIVLAVPPAPVDGLYRELKAAAPQLAVKVHRIGDALAPRRAHAAVIDGERVGAAL
jgi:mycofactocin system FadH/OYE family oxidoreductase 2